MKNYFKWIFILLLSAVESLHAQNLLWAKQMGGNLSDVTRAMVIDLEGFVYSAGNFTNKSDFDPGPDSFFLQSTGLQDVFITKLDANGNLVWAHQIGGGFVDNIYAMSLDAAGNIYCGGFFSDTADFDPGPGTYNLMTDSISVGFAAKYDQDGQLLWAKAIGERTDSTKRNYVNAITHDAESNVYLLGGFSGTADFDPGSQEYPLTSSGNADIVFSKLDADGNFLWAKRIGGFDHQQGYNLKLDADNNIFLCGNFSNTVDFDPGPGLFNMTTFDADPNAFIMKTNPSGELLWAKYFPGQDVGVINDFEFDQNNNLCLTGYFNGETDFDPGPNTHLVSNGGDEDGFVCQLDQDGNFNWVIRMTGEGIQEGTDLVIKRNADQDVIYLTGFYSLDLILDQGSGALDLQSVNSSLDVFFMQLSTDSLVEHTISLGGPGQDLGYALAVGDQSANEGIYVAGSFRSTADFDPGAGDFSLTSKGSSDAFVVKLSDFTTGILDTHPLTSSILVYPNPANTSLTIRVGQDAITNINIYDPLARKVKKYTTTFDPEFTTIDISALENGIYFLTFHLNGHPMCKKVIIDNSRY